MSEIIDSIECPYCGALNDIIESTEKYSLITCYDCKEEFEYIKESRTYDER
jgi:transcription elongation factor Elf1